MAGAGVLAGGLGWVAAWRMGLVELRWISLLLVGIFGFFWVCEARLLRVEGLPVEVVVGKAHWMHGKVLEVIEREGEKRASLRVGEGWLYGLGAVGDVRLGVAKSRISDLKPDTYVVAEVKLLPAEAAGYRHGYDGRMGQFLNRFQWVGYVQGELSVSGPRQVKTGDFSGSEGMFRGFEGIFEAGKGNQGYLAGKLEDLRRWVKVRVAGLGDGVVAALLIGDKGGVDRELVGAYRRSGLLHLMVISGLQLTLVAGGVFLVVRRLLACWPWLTLRYNIKAFSALAGLLAAGGYTVLIGWQVSVLRAFGMTALAMLALIIGRFHMLVRGWALALLAILALWPEMAVNAGFQLSFAAVLGLLVYGLAVEDRTTTGDKLKMPRAGFAATTLKWLGHMVGTSVMASAVTAPILAFHFGLVSVVGVAANLLAIPPMIVATWLGFAGFLLAPAGGEMLAWKPMAMLVDGVNRWARYTASWPLAQVATGGWPDLVVLDGGKAALARHGEKDYTLLWGGTTRVVKMWSERMAVAVAPAAKGSGKAWATPAGWVVQVEDVATPEDCAKAAVILAGEAGGACPERTLVKDGFTWAELRGGALEVGALHCVRRWEIPFCEAGRRR